MKVLTMRTLDQWVGLPACWALTFIRPLLDIFRGPPPPDPRRILFLKLAEQGSTVLAYPAIRWAVDRVGRENVYFLVFEENRFILDALEVIPEENVFTVSSAGLTGFLATFCMALRAIRRNHIDATVDLEFFARSTAIISFFSGAQCRVGLHAFARGGPPRGNLMTHRVHFNPHIHTSSMFQVMVESLAQPSEMFPASAVQPPGEPTPLPVFAPRDGETDAGRALLAEVAGGDVQRLLLFNPSCGDMLPLRKWESSRYVELARRLIETDPTLTIGFTGAPAEQEEIGRLATQVGSARCVSLAGRTTMRQLLVLYTMTDVVVTNDSGPAHFAALTTADVVTLFGPETPELFGARTPRNHIIWAGLACSPCVNAYNNRRSACRNNLCMQSITVDRVYDVVCRAIAQRRPDGVPPAVPN